MEKPRFAPNSAYQLMNDCWNATAHHRPTFADLEHLLGQQLEHSARQHYIDMNESYELANFQATGSPDYLDLMANVSAAQPSPYTALRRDLVQDNAMIMSNDEENRSDSIEFLYTPI